jgi:hypothetical protein
MSIEDIKKVLECVVNEGECRFDHHGYCQEHGWMSTDECFVAVAKRLLDTFSNNNKDFDYSMSMMERFVRNNQNETHDQYSEAWYHLRALLIANNKELLKWTNVKPTQEGDYWLRDNPENKRGYIVCAYEARKGELAIHGDEGDTLISKTPDEHMWYGPIKSPPVEEENEDA